MEPAEQNAEVEVFAIPNWIGFLAATSAGLAVCLATLAFIQLCLATLRPPPHSPWVEAVAAAVAGGLATLGFRLDKRLRAYYHVGEAGISLHRRGCPPVMLRWSNIEKIQDLTRDQRLELHGSGPDGPLVLQLKNRTPGFERLRAIVLERTPWEKLIGVANERLCLPATFWRTRAYLGGMWLALLFFSGTAALACWQGEILIGLLLLPLLAYCLNDWHSVVLDHGAITMRHRLRHRVLTEEMLESVTLGNIRGSHAASWSAVVLWRVGGRRIPLMPMRDGALELLGAIRLALPQVPVKIARHMEDQGKGREVDDTTEDTVAAV